MSTSAAVDASTERAEALVRAGAEILSIAGEPRLPNAFELLAARGISSLIVEGGVALHRGVWDARLVDRVQIYGTPRVLGPRGLEWLGLPLPRLGEVTTRALGTDTLTEAYVHGAD